jgi:hypothetical protein
MPSALQIVRSPSIKPLYCVTLLPSMRVFTTLMGQQKLTAVALQKSETKEM